MSERLLQIEKLVTLGEAARALELLRDFLCEEPDNVRALNDLGAVLMAKGEGEEAEAAFRRALELAPSREISLNLSLALAARNKWEEAAELAKKLLAENQNDPKLWALLARAEQAAGNRQGALDYLDRALSLAPDQADLKSAREKLAESGDKKPLAERERPSVLMCCQASLEHLALDLCRELEKSIEVKTAVAASFGPFQWPLKEARVIWLEWGSHLAAEATRHPELLGGKKVILRLHSFEILGSEAADINYDLVTDVIFVSRFMRSLAQRKLPGRLDRLRAHVIHHGIDLEKFSFIPNRGVKKKIAFIGNLDAPKDPMLMLQAFTFLHKRHPELELHVAGLPDNKRYYLAMPDMIAKNSLEECTHFYGRVKDMPGWLADKDYVFCTSPIESQGVPLLEAMHRGARPLIYNFPGASELYPHSFLWSNLDELEKLVLEGPEPEEASRFVAEKYSMGRQAASFLKVISADELVEEPLPFGENG